jgi:molecular chaperone DnaJ
MGDDLYGILNVSRDASPEEIKKAFKKKAVELHPDKTNGDKEKEDQFKKINEAYSVLTDPKRKEMYDRFGTLDESMMGGGPNININDIFGGLFGGGGMPMGPGAGPGGFQFVFMNENGGEEDDVFAHMFGGGRPRPPPCDSITVPVDINDIFYGKTKKLEFELLEQCNKCNGCGAQDESAIIKCITCNGNGFVVQQIGPFVQRHACPSCAGNGSSIKNGKACLGCKGAKTIYTKKAFELRLPKGINNNHEVRLEGKGSYDMQTKRHKDILIRFVHDIKKPYALDDNGNVTYDLDLNIEELLAGFDKKIKLFNEDFTITSDKYFNPNHLLTVKGSGVFNSRRGKSGDLYVRVHVHFTDSEKLAKYNDVFHKIFKKKNNKTGEQDATDTTGTNSNKNIINVQDILP